jgi:predicted DNA-binding transcriptional regulator AlpA
MTRLLRFNDLRDRQIVNNRTTLYRWIARDNFPRGRLIGPNTRIWTEEEINSWLQARPV